MERYMAVDNVCAWPNLTLMPDGSIIAAIFNQPSHGKVEGDVECWASEDGGRLWERRGVAAPHEPGTNRMNVAAGLAPDGALVVLASGWDLRQKPIQVLSCWACRSEDDGRTWKRGSEVPLPDGAGFVTPFGDIVSLPDGSIAASLYFESLYGKGNRFAQAYLMFSRDRGESWGDPVEIGTGDHNETDILRLREDHWIAAARTRKDGHVDLFHSRDEGLTWEYRKPLTLPRQHPAHLCRLADGRILLVYGIRNSGLYGVGARLSDDGETWSAPRVLVNFEVASDGGYPASVQLEDGTIVTAYYANRIPAHNRYHMGVLRWRADE